MAKFKKGQTVEFKYADNYIKGTVEEVHTTKVTFEIKGKEITRNATPEEPVYLIKTENGNLAAHSESEIKVT